MVHLDIFHLTTGGCIHMGPIAQLVEQRTFNPWVDGSIPSGPTQNIANTDQLPKILTNYQKSLIINFSNNNLGFTF